jgi:P4 family phage/plasmid primase-like protien
MNIQEKFDTDKLNLLKKCTNLPLTKPDELEDPNWKKNFEKSLKAYDGNIIYSKAKNKNYGRFFCDGKYGYQKFPRDIRNYLAKDFYIDLDIKNCHLVLLQHLFTKYQLNVPGILINYNQNRNTFIDKYNLKDGKLFMIKFINNDNCWYNDFKSFHDAIFNELVPLLINDYQIIFDDTKNREKNKLGSFLANVLQDIENDILMSMVNTCNFMNIEIGALCFDGLLIDSNINKSDVINTIEANILKDLGYQVTIEEKSMDTEWEPITDDIVDLEVRNRDRDVIINQYFVDKYSNGNLTDISYKKDTIVGKIMNNKELRVEHFRHDEECRGDLFYNININRDIENQISTTIKCKNCGYNHDTQQCNNTIVYQLIYNNVHENRDELSIIIKKDKQLRICDNEYINQRLYLALTQEDGYIREILYELFKNKCIFLENKNKWYIFNGIVWVENSRDSLPVELLTCISTTIRELILDIYNQHNYIGNLDNELDILNKITTNLSRKLNKNNEDSGYVSASKLLFTKNDIIFDKNSNLIAFQNGVYNLNEMIFRQGSPNDFLTIQMPYDFIFEENTNQKQYLIQFLTDILPNKEVRDFLLYNIASCLLGCENREQEFYILTGKKGANGKSVLSNLIEDTFGNFYAAPEPTLLTKPREKANEANEALKDLIGKRIAIISEPDKRDKLQASNLKKFTGGDTMTVRGLHEKSQKMKMHMKFFMLCNSIPLLDDCKEAEIRRLCVINFPTRFCENPIKSNEKQIDITVPEQLKQCKSEFFKLLLGYLVDYKKKSDLGNKISKPPEVTKQLENYIKRNKTEVDRFIETNLEYKVGTSIHCYIIWDLYKEFCDNDIKNMVKSNYFFDTIESYFDLEPRDDFSIEGVKRNGWRNICIKYVNNM